MIIRTIQSISKKQLLLFISSFTIFFVFATYLYSRKKEGTNYSEITNHTNKPLLSDKEIEKYYRDGINRLEVHYHLGDEDHRTNFEQEIDPIITKYIAYSEYQMQTYAPMFSDADTESSNLNTIACNVYETYEKINEHGNYQYRYIIAYTDIFTNSVNVYFDLDEYITEDDIAKVATHEMIHILQYTYAQDNGSLLPKWYTEGMAEYLQYDPLYLSNKYPIIDQKPPPKSLDALSQLLSSETYNDRIQGYIVSRRFFEYLLTHNDECTLAIMDINENFKDGFIRLFGKESEGMYTQFLLAGE